MYSKIKLCAKENTSDFISQINTILDYGVELKVDRDNLISQKYLYKIVAVESIKTELLMELSKTSDEKYRKNLKESLLNLNEMTLQKIVDGSFYRHEDILDVLSVFPESEVLESTNKLKTYYKKAYDLLSFKDGDAAFYHNYESPMTFNLLTASMINKEYSLNLWEEKTSHNLSLIVKEIEKAIVRKDNYSDINSEDVNQFILLLHPNILDEVLKSKQVVDFLLDTNVMGFSGGNINCFSRVNFYQHLFLKSPELVFDVLDNSEFGVQSLFKLASYLEKSYLSGASADGMLLMTKMGKEFLNKEDKKAQLQSLIKDTEANNNWAEFTENVLGEISLTSLHLLKENLSNFDDLIIKMLLNNEVELKAFCETLKELNWDLESLSEKEQNSIVFMFVLAAIVNKSLILDFKELEFFKNSFKEFGNIDINFGIKKTFNTKEDSIASHLINVLTEVNDNVNLSIVNKIVANNLDSFKKSFVSSKVSFLEEKGDIDLSLFLKAYPVLNTDNISKEQKSALDLLYFTSMVNASKLKFGVEYDFIDLVKQCSGLLRDVLPEHLEILKNQGDVFEKFINNEKIIGNSLLPILMNLGWLKEDVEQAMDNFDIKIEQIMLETLTPANKSSVKLKSLKF